MEYIYNEGMKITLQPTSQHTLPSQSPQNSLASRSPSKQHPGRCVVRAIVRYIHAYALATARVDDAQLACAAIRIHAAGRETARSGAIQADTATSTDGAAGAAAVLVAGNEVAALGSRAARVGAYAIGAGAAGALEVC
jgi:hypothetical protein